ncbi:hypothetical protein CPB86DRAFT_784874, partial [Serendipita vermifera]
MDDGSSSAVERTPQEVWWMILDEAIDVPAFFATTYEGNDWPKYDELIRKAEQHDMYRQSEVQRKIIGSVCRSWQTFSQCRRGRMVALKEAGDWEMEATRTARIVSLNEFSILDSPLAQGIRLEWEVFKTRNSEILSQVISILLCPRIRRLESSTEPVYPGHLDRFTEITWLDCERSLWLQLKNQIPVILPKLQVLRCDSGDSLGFPMSSFILPSLRYIYIHVQLAKDTDKCILKMLLPWRESIQSAVLRSTGSRTKVSASSIQFPSWKDFPNLKELELSIPWSFHFEPLPSNHPLQKLNAQHETFDTIPSFIEGSNMRQLILRNTRWTELGELMGRTHGLKLDAEKAAQLLDNAKSRGIQLKVSEWGKRL